VGKLDKCMLGTVSRKVTRTEDSGGKRGQAWLLGSHFKRGSSLAEGGRKRRTKLGLKIPEVKCKVGSTHLDIFLS